MSAQVKSQRYASKDNLDAISNDDLSDYIKYQDEVLDRNVEELKGVIEAQEEQIREKEEFEQQRTDNLYNREDRLDTIDAKIRQNIERIDSSIKKRIDGMERKTDEYMEDLAKRNAQWSSRLNAVGTDLAAETRSKASEYWTERQEQKRISKEYESEYTKGGREEVWDDDSTIIVDSPATAVQDSDEIMEAIELKQPVKKQQRRKTSHAPKPRNVPAKSKKAIRAQRMKLAQEQQQSRQDKHEAQQQSRQKQYQERQQSRKEQRVQAPKQKIHPQYTTTLKQETRPQVRTAAKKAATTHKSYPCPTCQKPLIYYDKYKRWWCRSCKKWR